MQIVASLHPQIILFAIGNPGEEDLEMMRELHERFPDPVFVALTTSEVPGQERMTLDYGAHHVLTKAASSTELIFTIKKLFQQNISPRTLLHKHKKERRAHRALDQPG